MIRIKSIRAIIVATGISFVLFLTQAANAEYLVGPWYENGELKGFKDKPGNAKFIDFVAAEELVNEMTRTGNSMSTVIRLASEVIDDYSNEVQTCGSNADLLKNSYLFAFVNASQLTLKMDGVGSYMASGKVGDSPAQEIPPGHINLFSVCSTSTGGVSGAIGWRAYLDKKYLSTEKFDGIDAYRALGVFSENEKAGYYKLMRDRKTPFFVGDIAIAFSHPLRGRPSLFIASAPTNMYYAAPWANAEIDYKDDGINTQVKKIMTYGYDKLGNEGAIFKAQDKPNSVFSMTVPTTLEYVVTDASRKQNHGVKVDSFSRSGLYTSSVTCNDKHDGRSVLMCNKNHANAVIVTLYGIRKDGNANHMAPLELAVD